MDSSDNIEMVVCAHIRSDNLIDVCTEDGEVLTTVNQTQWFFFLKGVNINDEVVYRFKRKKETEEYYVYSVNVKKLNSIININNQKDADKN